MGYAVKLQKKGGTKCIINKVTVQFDTSNKGYFGRVYINTKDYNRLYIHFTGVSGPQTPYVACRPFGTKSYTEFNRLSPLDVSNYDEVNFGAYAYVNPTNFTEIVSFDTLYLM
jgi:hypothetical protein